MTTWIRHAFARFHHVCVLAACLVFLITAHPVAAAPLLPEGQKTITLIANDGAKQRLGSVTFTPDEGGAKIAISIDAPELKDEFLSMRPFRCLPDAKEMWCHLAYPYAWKGRITADDLTDLEYAMLFLFKPPSGYGIDAWNGLYFKLALAADGRLSGALHETDLNALAVPPDAANLRPIIPAALTPVAPDAHRFAKIEIE
jgi:hypothetical protein